MRWMMMRDCRWWDGGDGWEGWLAREEKSCHYHHGGWPLDPTPSLLQKPQPTEPLGLCALLRRAAYSHPSPHSASQRSSPSLAPCSLSLRSHKDIFLLQFFLLSLTKKMHFFSFSRGEVVSRVSKSVSLREANLCFSRKQEKCVFLFREAKLAKTKPRLHDKQIYASSGSEKYVFFLGEANMCLHEANLWFSWKQRKPRIFFFSPKMDERQKTKTRKHV